MAPTLAREEAAVKEYEYTVNGISHTAQFSDEDAKHLGLKAVTPKNKQAQPANKADGSPRISN